MKARVVIYDDILIADETEVSYSNMKNLEAITVSCLRSTPGAEIAEAYSGGKLKLKLQITKRGKIKKLGIHPNWGGRRKGSGRKPIGGDKALSVRVAFRVDIATYEFLQTLLNKKWEFVRAAIREKIEREK